MKFREKYRFSAFYSGSSASDSAFCDESKRLFCVFGDAVNVLDVTTGQKTNSISLDGDAISAIALSPGQKIGQILDLIFDEKG